MLYHCTNIKYVKYGTIEPHFSEENWVNVPYKWLSYYCGYFPQLWLSISDKFMTGFSRRGWGMPRQKRNQFIQKLKGDILFCFDEHKVNGKFFLFSDKWDLILSSVCNLSFNPKTGLDINYTRNELNNLDIFKKDKLNVELINSLNNLYVTLKDETPEEAKESLDEMEKDCKWLKYNKNLDMWLKKEVFIRRDQLVVSKLNLKSATKIIVKNEKQKKELRHMGFIEDRIKIKK